MSTSLALMGKITSILGSGEKPAPVNPLTQVEVKPKPPKLKKTDVPLYQSRFGPEFETLLEMLTYRRPHKSQTEQEFIADFLQGAVEDAFGNLYLFNPRADGSASRTMFSAHTDTVHRDDGYQKIEYDDEFGLVWKSDNEPLGADNAAGVWLLLCLYDAGVPGTYVFHRGEEKGGLGSKWIREQIEDFLDDYDRAIAFDRKADCSVITFQSGDRCCSDVFGQALCDLLNKSIGDDNYKLDTGGVFTDTANYTDRIAECTNVSVGYYDEHTGREQLDLNHLSRLLKACLQIDWEALPTSRDPLTCTESLWRAARGKHSPCRRYDFDDDRGYYSKHGLTGAERAATMYDAWEDRDDPIARSYGGDELYVTDAMLDEIKEHVTKHPDMVVELLAALLEQGAVDPEEVGVYWSC